jgi:phosphocarrier protein HPr
MVNVSSMTVIKSFEIKNRLGIHARVAAKMVGVASRFRAKIYLEKDGQEVDAKSLLGILTLACPQNSFLTVRAEGDDAEEAVSDFEKLIEDKFGED